MKKFYDDRATSYLISNFTKVTKIYAKLNKATLDDDYLQIKSASNKEFLSISRIQNDISASPTDIIAEAAILLDSNRDLYQRSVFSIFDLFGKIGGISNKLKKYLKR